MVSNTSVHPLTSLGFFLIGIMDQVMQFVEPSRQFVKDSIRLVKRCTKPDRKGNCFKMGGKMKSLHLRVFSLISFCLIAVALFYQRFY